MPAGVVMEASFNEELSMHALQDFLSTDYGLMSAAGLAFMIGMGVFFLRYFLRHIREDSEAAACAERQGHAA